MSKERTYVQGIAFLEKQFEKKMACFKCKGMPYHDIITNL